MSKESLLFANSPYSLAEMILRFRMQGQSIALVPTMGYLHEGHLSLVEIAKGMVNKVVVSIFVNPTQFGENEDYDKYPRNLPSDIEMLKRAGANLLYVPEVADVYPVGYSTTVSVNGSLTDCLCGIHRPNHFDGVATVVAKLILMCLPDIALFGMKDFQQFRVIQQMTKDLNIPTQILGCPIVREKDGLAMSSRNSYLSKNEREIAPKLYELMNKAADAVRSGSIIAEVEKWLIDSLLLVGFDSVDYAEIRDEIRLHKLDKLDGNTTARLFVAAFMGKTRLIDNVEI